GALVSGTTRVTDGFGLSKLVDVESDDSTVIESLYLRTLSRKPTADERKRWLAFVTQPRKVVHTTGPAPSTVQGKAAQQVSPEIANAAPDTDFNELLKHAKTGADFTALRSKMKNNADAGLYARAFRAFASEAPFEALAAQGGGATPRHQAFEDMYWALVNCTEFLTNH
ncbi:MAG TPA: hypothetical protein VHV77_01145, partial [Pirellulales bacterium]|nr:hypothetical protein [Pirellulales bacterium]